MKTIYIDCQMGAAGDMLMGALLELVPDREKFLKKIRKEIELLMEPYGVGNGRPD